MGAMKDMTIDMKNSFQFFARVDADHWMPHNKAEAAAQDLARGLSRQLIQKDKVEEFCKDFEAKIREIEKANPRCRPLVFWKNRDYDYLGDLVIGCDGVFRFVLEWVKA